VSAPDEQLATYSVGDYVWAYFPKGNGHSYQLSCIASATPRQATNGQVLWSVFVRRAQGWSVVPVERRVFAALAPAQIAHQRQIGLIGEERPS